MRAADEERAARKLRRDERMRTEGDQLEKKRRLAAEEKEAHEAKKQAAIQTMLLLREQAKTAELLILCIGIITYVGRAPP